MLAAAVAAFAPIGGSFASAAILTKTYDITATGFFVIGDPASLPPALTANLNVTVSFDAALEYDDSTALQVNSITPDYLGASGVAFDYLPASDQITFGGVASTVDAISNGTDDFFVVIDNATAVQPVMFEFSYSHVGVSYNSLSTTGLVTRPVAAPEPTIAAPFILAGFAMRRRRT